MRWAGNGGRLLLPALNQTHPAVVHPPSLPHPRSAPGLARPAVGKNHSPLPSPPPLPCPLSPNWVPCSCSAPTSGWPSIPTAPQPTPKPARTGGRGDSYVERQVRLVQLSVAEGQARPDGGGAAVRVLSQLPAQHSTAEQSGVGQGRWRGCCCRGAQPAPCNSGAGRGRAGHRSQLCCVVQAVQLATLQCSQLRCVVHPHLRNGSAFSGWPTSIITAPAS